MITKNKMYSHCLLTSLILGGLFFTATQVEGTSTLGNKGTVDFEVADTGTSPTDPEKPDEKIDIDGPVISTEGPLRFDYIPNFSFGKQLISTKDQEYYADPISLKNSGELRANYIQVTDNRGSATGWRVTVKQEQEFTSKESGEALKGAYLSFDNQWTSSATEELGAPVISRETIRITDVGSNYPLATAEAGTGTGTWMISFGSAHEHSKMKNTFVDRDVSEKALGDTQRAQKNTSVRLVVPGDAEKKQEEYFTILTWTLSEI